MSWGFYGRSHELDEIARIIGRGRWFFAKITGRRRIGKTSLIQRAIQSAAEARPVYYVQIPDSGPAGVISAVIDALETFGVPTDRFAPPRNLSEFAKLIEGLARAGYIVVLDIVILSNTFGRLARRVRNRLAVTSKL